MRARLTKHGHHGVDGVGADVVVDVELAPPRISGEERPIGYDDATDVGSHVLRFSEGLQIEIRTHGQGWRGGSGSAGGVRFLPVQPITVQTLAS